MQIPLQITFKNMDSSPAIEARIEERVAKLERFSDRVTSCRVLVEAPHRHHHKGRLYRVTVDLTLPPKQKVVATREHKNDHAHEDVYVAIRDAFDAVQRRLEDAARKNRGKVKHHEAPPHGRVLRLFPDHGFIELADGQEIYFHENSVVDFDFAKLEVGDEVRVAVAENESAEGPQATTVHHIGKHHIVS